MTTHAAGRDARHPAEQQAAAAERLLEEVRARLRREPAGDLAHRREQRQPAVVGLDRLVRDGGDPAVDERARERLVGGDVEVREEHEPLAQARVLGRDRLLDLEQHLGPPDLVDVDDPRAHRRSASSANELPTPAPSRRDLVAALDELERARGVSATRYSSDLISLATPTLTAREPYPASALDEPPLLGAEMRRLCRARVLVVRSARLRRGDDEVDPLVRQRPLEERLRPRLDADCRSGSSALRRLAGASRAAAERAHDDDRDAELGGSGRIRARTRVCAG